MTIQNTLAEAARVAAACLLLLCVGCTSTHRPAPVSERTPAVVKPATKPVPATPVRDADPRPEVYTVKAGDTLYAIALDNGLDHKELAEWNNLTNPNVIRVGQQLRLRAPASAVLMTPLKISPAIEAKPVAGSTPPPASSDGAVKTQPVGVKLPYSDQALAQLSGQPQAKPLAPAGARSEPAPEGQTAASAGDEEKVEWGWPAGGKLVSAFNETTNLKGIGIAGSLGQPVVASAPGRVLYSGDGIRGYGKLLIIKHNSVYLSVYAHNSQLSVKEGQSVVKGQKIAEMGNSDADQIKLHFEIRRFGKPVDPIRLLPAERPA